MISSSDYLICSNRALRMIPCELNIDNILYMKAYDCLLCNYCGNIVIKTSVVYVNIANSEYYWYIMLT